MKGRPPAAERTFRSQLVEEKLQAVSLHIKDSHLSSIFAQCWLSTLDTTVFAHDGDLKQKDHARARPTSWIITGELYLTALSSLHLLTPHSLLGSLLLPVKETFPLPGCETLPHKW